MFVLKNMFNRIFENKLAVVADYYEIKLMKDKQRRKEYDQSCQRIDPFAPNTGKEIQKTLAKIPKSTQGFSCPTCLNSYRGYLVFKCKKCEQPFLRTMQMDCIYLWKMWL